MSILDHIAGHIRELIPYVPGKPIEEVEREYGLANSAKLASNENPLGPSPKALEVLSQRLHELHLYPDGDCFHLRRALAQRLGVSPEELIFGNGSNELLELAVRTFLHPGDEAMVAHRTFIIYRLVVQAAGGVPRLVSLRDFTHDLAAMAEAITPRTRMIFLANPSNPTGTIFKTEEWETFLDAVPGDVLLVMDEAYFEYVEDARYPDSLRYHAEKRAILTLRTFSKLYGLAGLRIGYGVAPRGLVALMNRVRQPFNVNSAAQWAALAAIEDRAHVEKTLANNRRGRVYLEEQLQRLGLQYVPSHANFLLVRVGDARDVFERLLPKGVIVRPMGAYDLPEHVRVTVGLMEENVKFIEALADLLDARTLSPPARTGGA